MSRAQLKGQSVQLLDMHEGDILVSDKNYMSLGMGGFLFSGRLCGETTELGAFHAGSPRHT
jgi:hypothetical protein